jgi:hypothetical protein
MLVPQRGIVVGTSVWLWLGIDTLLWDVVFVGQPFGFRREEQIVGGDADYDEEKYAYCATCVRPVRWFYNHRNLAQ